MKTIRRYDGRSETLSDEIYRITTNNDQLPQNYQKGCFVRLISGVDNKPTPGYHFSPGFVTVCSIKEVRAGFIGVKRRYLKKVDGPIIEPLENSGFTLLGKVRDEEIVLSDNFYHSLWKAVEKPEHYGINHDGKVFEFIRLALPGDKWWSGIKTPA